MNEQHHAPVVLLARLVEKIESPFHLRVLREEVFQLGSRHCAYPSAYISVVTGEDIDLDGFDRVDESVVGYKVVVEGLGLEQANELKNELASRGLAVGVEQIRE